MARGGYRQLHDIVHPELLHLKRQQQQQQQQLTSVIDALRDSHDVIQKLSAKVTRQIPSWVLLPWPRTLTAARRSLSFRTLLMTLQAGRAGAFDDWDGHVLQSSTRAHGSHDCCPTAS